MIKIIRRCQNSRLVEGFHPLFHESVVAPLFVGVCGCFVGVCGCFWVFVGVRGVTICHYLAQTCPWDHLARRKKKICCLIKNDREAATFVNLIFRNLDWNDNVKSFFCIVGTSWMGWGRVEWHWHMGMSYLTSLSRSRDMNFLRVPFPKIVFQIPATGWRYFLNRSFEFMIRPILLM